MTEKKLYFISKDIYSDVESEAFWRKLKLYTNLESALDELNNNSKYNDDFKWNYYCVRTLTKVGEEYIRTHETYYHQKKHS